MAARDVPWGRLRGVQLLRDKDRHVGRGERNTREKESYRRMICRRNME